MLILTRRVGESFTIDKDVHIKIVDVRGKQVRIGIEAPKETRVFRDELLTNQVKEKIDG